MRKLACSILSVFSMILLGLFCFLFASCGDELTDDLQADFSTSYIFFSYSPELTESPDPVTISYPIGTRVPFSSLPSATTPAFFALKPGYKIDFWLYYKNPVTGSKDLPSNITCRKMTASDGTEFDAIDSFTVASAPASFVVHEWLPITYYIVLNGNGGFYTDADGTTISQEKVDFLYDKSAALPANKFVRNGYVHNGWARTASAVPNTPEFKDSDVVINLSNVEGSVINLFACWLKEKINISFEANGGSGTMATLEQVSVGDVLPACTFTAPVGHYFGSWTFTKSDGSIVNSYPDGATLTEANYPNENATFVAQWLLIPYTVTFDSQGGSIVPSQTVGWSTCATSQVATKTGYDFGGWYTDSACTSAYDFTTPVTADITLYAKWNIQSRTVNYDLDGGTGTVPASETIDFSSWPYTPAHTATKTGYIFDGWTASESEWSTEPVTFTAKWKPKGSIIGTIPAGIGVTYTATGMTFTVTSGNPPYQWIIDEAFASGGTDTLSISYTDYSSGTHLVFVCGTPGPDGIFTAAFQFEVQ